VRALVLRPLIAAVATADSLSRGRRDESLHRGRLIGLLTLIGLGGMLLSPLLALAGLAHVATHRDPEAEPNPAETGHG
jgi:MFS family permease